MNKWVTVLFLLFLYVLMAQTYLAKAIAPFFSYLDELALVSLAGFLAVYSIVYKRINKYVLGIILVLLFYGTVSIINHVTIIQIVVGYWDIWKNFIFILALPVLVRILKISANTINVFFQSFIGVCILFSIAFYLFPTSILNPHPDHVRMGIYRLSTIIADINTFAMVLFIIFWALYFDVLHFKFKKIIMGIIILMIFLTFSRSTLYIMTLLVLILNIKKIKQIALLLPFIAVFVLLILKSDSGGGGQSFAFGDVKSRSFDWDPTKSFEFSDDLGETQYRAFVYYKSVQMFLDKPLLGHGLGTFGTPISLIKKSPVYKDYGFPQTEFVEGGFNIQDVYYPILYVQTGIIGMIIILVMMFRMSVKKTNGRKFYMFSLLTWISIFLLGFNTTGFCVTTSVFTYAILLSIPYSQDYHVVEEDESITIYS